MKRWLAGVVSRQVLELRLEVETQQRVNGVLRERWAEALGEARRANSRALELAAHLEHCVARRDRYHTAWRSARVRAQLRADALRVAVALLDLRHEETKGAAR